MLHNDSRRRPFFIFSAHIIVALQVVGCSASDGNSYDEDETDLRSQSLTGDSALADDFPIDAPDELVIRGRRYVREFSLTIGELRQLKNPKLWEAPADVDKMAQLVREYIVHPEYGEYVEDRPNYELARIALGIDPSPMGLRSAAPGLTATGDVLEKKISTNGDQRAVVASNTGSPANAIALFEGVGSGVQVGSGRIYTAGHVLYRNANGNPGGPVGWKCRDGSLSASGACSGIGWPRWRFGGKITNPGPNETWNFVGGWVSCGTKSIPSAWKNMPHPTGMENATAVDYGRADLSGCLPAGVGGIPWWTASQTDLRTHSLNAYGYPFLTSCPAGASGVNSDCPSGINQLRTNGATAPISAGSVFVGVPVTDSTLVAQLGYIKSNKVDTTKNMSGGPIVAFDTVPSSQWWVVGVDSAGHPSNFGETWYNHLTSTVVNFVFQ